MTARAVVRLAVALLCAIAAIASFPRVSAGQTTQSDQSDQTEQADQDSQANQQAPVEGEALDSAVQYQVVDGKYQRWLDSDVVVSVQGENFVAEHEPQPEPEPTDAPPEVRLKISTSKTNYFIGEVIPIDLAFSAETPERFKFNIWNNARAGHPGLDRFDVDTTTGFRDPLKGYFDGQHRFFEGGWLSRTLLASATHMAETLNQWIEFDEPGTYRIRVTSLRVSDGAAAQGTAARLKVTSNWIELHIVAPDAAWQKETLAHALEMIEEKPGGQNSDTSERRTGALEQLRYLDTKASTRELARRLRGENQTDDEQYMLGLLGSPYRDAAQEEMNRLLADPDFPVTTQFLGTMAALSPGGDREPQYWTDPQSGQLARETERLVEVLPLKEGKAAATSLATVLENPGGESLVEIPAQLLERVVGVFSSLDSVLQQEFLQAQWPRVKSPQWLPVLRAIAQPERGKKDAARGEAVAMQLTAAALADWYDLDPDEAREAVIREITRPQPRFDPDALGFLADRNLPEAEEAIAKNFVSASSPEIEAQVAALLFRYATEDVESAVLDKVVTKVESENWDCGAQEKMLAYLVRVDPQTASDLIREVMESESPQQMQCRKTLLTDIEMDQNDPVLEPFALESLHDSDEQVTLTAVQYLGQDGLADAEKPLWDRYTEWSAEWKGRAKELEAQGDGGGVEGPQPGGMGLGVQLASAIASGPGWLTDPDKLQRAKQSAVVPEVASAIDNALIQWRERPLRVVCLSASASNACDTFFVAQYNMRTVEALKAKLSQFPRGTKFQWTTAGAATQAGSEATLREVAEFAKKRGIEVTREEPQATAIRTAAPGLN
jgi:hypothetical protein